MPALSTIAITAAIVGTGYQVERGQSAAREQRRSSRAQRDAQRESSAQQENERQAAIRQQLRQERIRQAQVMSAAEAVGVGGSSVEASTIGSGQTLAAAGRAFATGASESAGRQSAFLQQAARFNERAALDQAQGQLGGAFTQLGMAGLSAFGPGGT